MRSGVSFYRPSICVDVDPNAHVYASRFWFPNEKKNPRGLGITGYRGNREISTVYRANLKTEFRIQIFPEPLNRTLSSLFIGWSCAAVVPS
jgi:hypothetical protein